MDRKKDLMPGGVLALGNFDGVHRGHRLVVEAAVTKAQELDCTSRVLTFEPHPRSVFQPAGAPFRLTTKETKKKLLLHYGIHDVIAWPFTRAFADLTAQAFVEEILIRSLRVEHVVAGHDFVFGNGRAGTMDRLADWLSPHKVGVTEITPLRFLDQLPLSSSRVRACLQEGDVTAAADILGRPWAIIGDVARGAQLGRTIGFPTANITLGEYLRPRFGVYVVDAKRSDGDRVYRGVANIGVRPTLSGTSDNLEAHLFDFNEDIYGQAWEFRLLHFIRPEQKFETFEALTAQIARDAAMAREWP